MAIIRANHQGATETEYILWGLGVMVVGHMINWLGIIYFDQIYVIWFFQLATIASLTAVESRPNISA